jgi:excisionase family DNA binding protein
MVTINGRAQLLTPTEVAQLLHIHINTVRKWSDQGILKPYRIGARGDRRFDRDQIMVFLQNSSVYDNNGEKPDMPEPAT